MVVNIWNAMISWFRVRPTSKRWFLRIVEVTMKHDPFECRSGVVCSKLELAPPFPPMRVLEV
jgi:hypothetical protein